MLNPVPAAARAYHHAGLSVLPAQDAAKRPDLPTWTPYQHTLPTEAEIARWFHPNRARCCIVTGAVSGNLELLDFDCAGEKFRAWNDIVRAEDPALFDKLVIETSPSAGFHVVYRSVEPVGGNAKLAQRREDVTGPERVIRFGKPCDPREDRKGHGGWHILHTTIETRGEGGLYLCAPSPGYVLIQGDMAAPPVLTVAERDILLSAARSLNEVRQSPATTDIRPGDDFNRRGDVRKVLRDNGWTLSQSGENEHWSRPGKDTGTSATLKDGVFYVFSSNAAPFEPDTAYAPFSVYALLEHGGDFAAAARALSALGHGERATVTHSLVNDGASNQTFSESAVPNKLRVRRFTDTVEETPTWIWNGYIPRKATSAVGAKQGMGKGLTLADLVARVSRGDVMPDGSGGGEPGRVLIITREDDPAMALKPRLRVAGANMDNITWNQGDYQIGSDDADVAAASMRIAAPLIEAAVIEHRIDWVIIDPLGAWIEEDGNSSAQVRSVIDPMNRMCSRTGCAVTFVPHLRKAPSDDPMDAFAGSYAVTAAVRVATVISRLNETDRTWVVAKTNFRRPEVPMVWRLVSALDPLDPPRVEWRSASTHDVAPAARQAQHRAPLADAEGVRRHMVQEHRPLKAEARRIHKALMPSQPGLSVASIEDAISALVEDGRAIMGEGANRVRTVGLGPAMVVETALDRAVTAWEQHPQATVREIAAIASCSKSQADRARRMALSHGSVPSLDSEQRDNGTERRDNDRSPVPSLSVRPIGAHEHGTGQESEAEGSCPMVTSRAEKMRRAPSDAEALFPTPSAGGEP